MTLPLLAAWTIRSSFVLLAALGLSGALARRSAALRHWVLAVGIAGALAAPVAAGLSPHWSIARFPLTAVAPQSAASPADDGISVTTTVIGRSAATAVGASAPTSAVAAASRLFESSLLAVWAIGIAGFALALGAGLLRVWVVARRSRPMRDERWLEAAAALASERPALRHLTLLESSSAALLVTWGVQPRVLLPRGARTWTTERIAVVLAHEGAHIERRDWLVQILGEVLRTVFWFNPLAWLAADRLRLESERACDDRVLARGIEPSAYAHHLVDVARALSRSQVWAPLPAMARASSLERRVTAMLDNQINRSPLTRAARYLVAAILLPTTLSIASFAAQSTFATVSGVVRDQLAGTIPNVAVKLANLQSGAKYEVTSDSAGAFQFVGLPAGNYTMSTNAIGFKPTEIAQQIGAGQTLRRDVPLEVGTLQETIMVTEGRPWPATAGRPSTYTPDVPAACTAQPNSGGIKPPTKVADKKPNYPGSMIGTGIEGRVSLKATIGTDGAIKTMQTLEATNTDFDLSAQEAVRQWRFTPTLLNCVPVDVEMNVAIAFRPENAVPPPPPPPPAPPDRR